MVTSTVTRARLTTNQIRGFWAAWGGWALDGMDSFIYALVLAPALRELLPRSGIPSTTENVAYYGSVMFALFLIGWGLSMIWGPLADRFGRVRTLMLTILCYSVFTFLSGLVTNIWQLAICRLIAGIGIGGEWSMGGTFVAEEWPEDRRKMGAGYMHTGYYFGFFLAALANAYIGAKYGWRWMFILGGTPALLVTFIRYGVHESAAWRQRVAATRRPKMREAFGKLFSSTYARRTILNSTYLLVSIVGLWAGSVYVPTSIIQLATRAGYTAADAARLASYGTMVLSVGTILGCLVLPPLAESLGRRLTLGIYFLIMFFSISLGFGYVFYLPANALTWFFVVLFFLGVGGANFAMYTLWLPEQYSTECRASAFAFATSVGRFAGAGITFLVGAGVAYFHTIGTPVALTSIAFLIGLALLPLGEETKGKPLPA
ncbi:MAG: MFS transporter [Acidobacteria bacterium 13_1_40CM_65_14]|nr:MAG: MFS transporter [Acidobacteria bacterium 13_1_40CM_65_14]OLC76102.1 MAG: MFS transporter [Acidobacteria bacterium 13_1_40CM_4_65_8]OLE78836.1 MAG: MFS transporter [Acidobacteria bacterium 13_1_20CM_2_65_9]